MIILKRQINLLHEIIKKLIIHSRITPLIRRILKILDLYRLASWIFYKLNHFNVMIPIKNLIFFSRFLKLGDLCFDIGAWEGEYTKMFLKIGTRVIAVEPQKHCIKVLRIIYGNNKNVEVIGKAVGEQEGRGFIAISDNPYQSQKATMSKRFRYETRNSKVCTWSNFQPVLITTLDSLIEKYGIPSFCKIDVEGYEYSVIKGLNYPIPFISFEYHKELLDIIKSCCNHLTSIGKFVFNCTIYPKKTEFFFKNWVSANELYDKLSSIENELFCGDIYAKFLEN